MCVDANDANGRRDSQCHRADPRPVQTETMDGTDSTTLRRAIDQPAVTRPVTGTAMRRQQFNGQHREWTAVHNHLHDAQGLWNDDLRLW